jgi:hypothetical protein
MGSADGLADGELDCDALGNVLRAPVGLGVYKIVKSMTMKLKTISIRRILT